MTATAMPLRKSGRGATETGKAGSGPMSENAVSLGGGKSLYPHPLRGAVLGELHARPFTAIETPRRVLLFAFVGGAAQAEADREALTALCATRGMKPPPPGAKHHRSEYDGGALRWESHAEFSTYTWELPAEAANGTPFTPKPASIVTGMAQIPQPGPLLVAIDLHLIRDPGKDFAFEKFFDSASLVAANNSDGAAMFATDFKPDESGFIHILVINRTMTKDRVGALVQRVLELETYRTLALLGLPEAQRVSPAIGKIERRLAEVTDELRNSGDLRSNHKMLDEITALAAGLEADAAASAYRFGATRAYYEIVKLRLETIGEQKVGGLPTWTSFLGRRMAPAMRTIATVEERQSRLSEKLARAANLLRTRVDVALENQNRDLLTAINERGRAQLRLQQTVEGLSVAAISYYMVGLVSYLIKGAHEYGLHFDVSIATAASVPVIVAVVWFIVRRVRRRYASDH
jgi:uncharacterized membrane-anchored protein